MNGWSYDPQTGAYYRYWRNTAGQWAIEWKYAR